MGVDTKIKIPLQGNDVTKTVQAIKKVIADKLTVIGDIEIDIMHSPQEYDKENERSRFNMHEMQSIDFCLDYVCDAFDSGKEHRSIRTYYDHYSGGNMIDLSIGAWGHNEDIARCLVDSFGGYADFSD